MTALFAGSFNPFTIGHYDIARRALALCDRLVIAVGVNLAKESDAGNRVEAIRHHFASEPKVEVVSYSGLTTDLATEVGASVLIRGVRNARDLEYERDMATANRELSGIETILLMTKPEYEHVSSSLVRELAHYGKDTSKYLPHETI